MITNNILSDLRQVLAVMRDYGSRFTPESVLALIEGIRPDRDLEDENIIRQILRSHQLSSIPFLHFITTDNVYVYTMNFHSEELYIIIRDILFTCSVLIRERKEEQLYDFTDAIHEFPFIIHMQKIKSPKKLMKKMLKSYRKKWHCELFEYTCESN